MLCYRCGSHAPDTADSCLQCGQRLEPQGRGTAAPLRRPAGDLAGAPYRIGEVIAGRYEVRDAVGAGPLAFVLRCHDREGDADVSVKLVNPRFVQTPEEREQFAASIRLTRRFTHPSLSRAYDDGVDAHGWPYYTQVYLGGLTLRKIIDQRLSKGHLFTLREVEPILSQLVVALEIAHGLGPHADLKPSNVVIQPDLLKVLDFGFALGMPRRPFAQAQRASAGFRYLAPEFLGGFEVDGRADQYALGVLLGEMLGGVVPDGGIPALRSRNPELDAAVEGLYRRAVAERPDGRFPSLRELLAELQRLSAQSPARPRNPGSDPAARSLAKAGGALDATQPVSAAELEARLAEAETAAAAPSAVSLNLSLSNDLGHTPTPTFELRDLVTEDRPPPPVPTPVEVQKAMPTPHLESAALAGPPAGQATETFQVGTDSLPGAPALFAASRRPSVFQRPGLWLSLLAAVGVVLGGLLGWSWVDQTQGLRKGAPVRPGPPGRGGPAGAVDGPSPPAAAPGEGVGVGVGAGAGAVQPAAFVAKDGRCPLNMRWVPSGVFRMGSPLSDAMRSLDERPVTAVDVAAFCIDQFEFPNQPGASPLGGLSWAEALGRCQAVGKRLCTEPEWEKACKGPDSRRFPYGEAADAAACNTGDRRPGGAPGAAGAATRCVSAYGVADLSGNLAEWVYGPYEPNSPERTQKGGSFLRPDDASRCAARKNGIPTARSAEVGFRCCLSASP